MFLPFWRVCHLVETLSLHNATATAERSPVKHWKRKRFARLKHIDLERDSMLRFNEGAYLPWLCAPHLETIRVRDSGSFSFFDKNILVTQISGATGATEGGTQYYFGGGLARGELYLENDDHEEWMCPNFRDPVKTEQQRGLITEKDS